MVHFAAKHNVLDCPQHRHQTILTLSFSQLKRENIIVIDNFKQELGNYIIIMLIIHLSEYGIPFTVNNLNKINKRKKYFKITILNILKLKN